MYLGNQYPGMVDYMIWPWMERLPSLPVLTGGVIKIEMEKFPHLVSFICDNLQSFSTLYYFAKGKGIQPNSFSFR